MPRGEPRNVRSCWPTREASRRYEPIAALEAPGDLYVVSPDDSLAGLRIIEDGIFLIDVVFCRKLAGVGCSPMLIQCLTYFLISHTTVLISVPVAFADQIPTRGYAALNHHLQFQQRRAE